MHINDKCDMSIFDGTQYEGLTYMQVRRALTPAQVRVFKSLSKRARKTDSWRKAQRRFISSYS